VRVAEALEIPLVDLITGPPQAKRPHDGAQEAVTWHVKAGKIVASSSGRDPSRLRQTAGSGLFDEAVAVRQESLGDAVSGCRQTLF